MSQSHRIDYSRNLPSWESNLFELFLSNSFEQGRSSSFLLHQSNPWAIAQVVTWGQGLPGCLRRRLYWDNLGVPLVCWHVRRPLTGLSVDLLLPKRYWYLDFLRNVPPLTAHQFFGTLTSQLMQIVRKFQLFDLIWVLFPCHQRSLDSTISCFPDCS